MNTDATVRMMQIVSADCGTIPPMNISTQITVVTALDATNTAFVSYLFNATYVIRKIHTRNR